MLHPIFVSRHFGRWLVAAMVITNLVVFSYTALSLQHTRDHYERQAEIQTQNLAQAIEQSVNNSTDKINQSLRAVVYEREQQLASGKIDDAIIQGAIALQKKLLPEAIGFRIIDANGNTAPDHVDTHNPTVNVADRDYFIHLKTHPGTTTFISKPIPSRHTGDWVIAFSHRINHPDGNFAGAATIPVSVDYFNNLLSKYKLGTSGFLVLRDLDLGVIARQPTLVQGENIKIGDRENLSPELSSLINAGSAGGTYKAYNLLEQVDLINSFRKIPNAPMYAIAGLSETSYLAQWRKDLWETGFFLALFALITSVSTLGILRIWKRQMHSAVALQQSHERLKTLFVELQERDQALVTTQEKGKLGTFVLDVASGIFTNSAELNALLGLSQNQPFDVDRWKKMIHQDDLEKMMDYHCNTVLTKNQPFDCEYRIIRPDNGDVRWLLASGKTDLDATGHPLRVRGVIRDITERKQHEEQLRLAREVFINVREAIIVTDENARILDVNPAFTDVTGFERDDVIGMNPNLLQSGRQKNGFYQSMWQALQQNGYWEGEFQNRHKDGRFYTQTSTISAVRNDHGQIVRFISIASDVTQLRASQRQMEHLAFHDRLTDLPNRAMLAEQLKLALTHAEEADKLLGVCYIDLDGFKLINDIWGHDTGDQVLVEVSARLRSCIAEADTVARLGGDEFVVLLGDAPNVSSIEQALQRILQTLSMPFLIEQQEADLSASIGVAIFPDDVDDADMLIRRADQAMYIAKRQGKNRFHLFDSETDRQQRADREHLQRVIEAMENSEFRLHYQPKVHMPTGKIIGVEALIRWQHPKRGLLPPTEFLPVIENTDFSIRLGEWVIMQALRQMADWAETGLEMPISVNISGYHLQQSNFVTRLSALLAEFPAVPPQWLQLEILETTAMEDIDLISDLIKRCCDLGVTFALDDFGTGYSSLTYFRRLPTHLMKIDRSFVHDMLNDAEDYALVESIVKLAHSFRRQVIAEGVETVEQGLSLMQIGCDLAQGFGIARPMPPEEFVRWTGSWVMPQVWRVMALNLSMKSCAR